MIESDERNLPRTASQETAEPGYDSAHERASRAASKHGNPAAHAVMCSADIGSSADVVTAQVYSEAYELDERSRRGDVCVRVGEAGDRDVHVVIEVTSEGEPRVDHGGFSLTFGPRTPRDGCPRFEGQIRVDQVDVANSRVVAQGRYRESSPASPGNERASAEQALKQIVGLLTTAFSRG